MYSVCNFLRNCHYLPWWLCIFSTWHHFIFPPAVDKGSSFFTSLPTGYFLGFVFFFCFVVFHEVLYHCNVDMFPRLVILRLYQVLFGHLCIIFFGETCIQVFCPPLLFFWPCYVACKIFVPQAGIKPVPPALGARSVNHWMDREVPSFAHLKIIFYF